MCATLDNFVTSRYNKGNYIVGYHKIFQKGRMLSMKMHTKIVALIAASVLTFTGMSSSIATIQDGISAAAVDDCNDDWLHTDGSRLYDEDGNEVWLTGLNWFGFNCTENFPHGLWSVDIDEMLSAIADHGFNIIRFPVSTELLVSWMEDDPLEVVGLTASDSEYYSFNPDFVDEDGDTMNSMEIFDVIMEKLKDYGLKAIIDVHSPASHNSGHNYNLWFYNEDADDADNMAVDADGNEITTEMWEDSLVWLADKYSNDDTILAYDLKNEPHGKRGYDGDTCPDTIAKWDDSTDENNWAYAATECGKAILEVNPNALIMIEGVEQYPKTEEGYTYDTADIYGADEDESPWYPAWWGGNLRGVADYPIDFGDDDLNDQIVYSPHDYGPAVYEQTWFEGDFDTESLLDDYWYDTWAYINDQEIAPLFMGEWGGYIGDGYEDNEKWMELLRDYMIENHISHTFWCLNPNSGDTGGLLSDDWTTWNDEKYEIVEPALWQTLETGLYIGLDHEYSLGVNGTGLSLNEFYESGSYAYTEGSNLDGGTILSEDGSSNLTDSDDDEETAETITGDINGDEEISLADLILILDYLLGNEIDDDDLDWELADVNDDDTLNGFDLALYRQYLCGTIDSF